MWSLFFCSLSFTATIIKWKQYVNFQNWPMTSIIDVVFSFVAISFPSKRRKKNNKIFLPTHSKNHLTMYLIDHYKCVCVWVWACLCTHFVSSSLARIRPNCSSHNRPTRIAIYPHLSLFLLITWMWCAECNVCYVSEKVIYCSFLGKKFKWTNTHASTNTNTNSVCSAKTRSQKRLMVNVEDPEKRRTKLEKAKKNIRKNDNNNTSRLTRRKKERS